MKSELDTKLKLVINKANHSDMTMNELLVAIKALFRECLPEGITPRAAIKTGSIGGAGYTIGWNACVKQILEKIK